MASSIFKSGDKVVTTDTVNRTFYKVGARGVVRGDSYRPSGFTGALDCDWYGVRFDDGSTWMVPAAYLRITNGLLDI